MISTGVTGQRWRAEVTDRGHVRTAEHDVGWAVAAEDRWHVAADEVAVRQQRIEGAPVVETRMRVLDGDAVHRAWSVADHGGVTLIEIENDSPLPIAAALFGAPLATDRPPSSVPPQGIELPADAIVLPVAHRTRVRVAIAHEPAAAGRVVPGQLPDPLAVARGWRQTAEAASRLVLPDPALVDAVVAARCDLLLDGPALDDPLNTLFDIAELVRLGEPADVWAAEIVEPVAAVARRDDPAVDDALVALVRMANHGDDGVAARDLRRLLKRRRRDGRASGDRGLGSLATVQRGASAGRFVGDVERFLAADGVLLPAGIPAGWRGANFEVYTLPVGADTAVSYAVRWHGERPAVLWEQHGAPTEILAPAVDPDWRTRDVKGEALWRAPRGARALQLGERLDLPDGGDIS
ncbi:MAG: hypothetical protein AAGA42_17950 [Actinomycetota bacterium]